MAAFTAGLDGAFLDGLIPNLDDGEWPERRA
jgi:hypothetical protein